MNQSKLNNLIKLVEEKSKGMKPLDFFMNLRDNDFSRLELMILDSAIKKMPMQNLYNTLLLPEEHYYKIIDLIIEKLKLVR